MVTETKTAVKQSDYELVVIFNPEVAEEALEQAMNGITQVITGKGGAITEVQKWGKKRLTYPIKHATEGNYVFWTFKLDPAFNKELETNLKISEKILRHLLIKV